MTLNIEIFHSYDNWRGGVTSIYMYLYYLY